MPAGFLLGLVLTGRLSCSALLLPFGSVGLDSLSGNTCAKVSESQMLPFAISISLQGIEISIYLLARRSGKNFSSSSRLPFVSRHLHVKEAEEGKWLIPSHALGLSNPGKTREEICPLPNEGHCIKLGLIIDASLQSRALPNRFLG